MIRMVYNSVVVIILVLTFNACGKTGLNPVGPTDPNTGKITVTIVSGGLPIQKAKVVLLGGSMVEQGETVSGVVVFNNLVFGEYKLVVSGFGIVEASQLVQLDKSQIEVTVEVARKNDLEMVNTASVCGSTIKYGSPLKIQLHYYLASTISGHMVWVGSGLSIDGNNLLGGTIFRSISEATGVVANDFIPNIIPMINPIQTRFVINSLVVKDRLGPVLEVLHQQVIPCDITFN